MLQIQGVYIYSYYYKCFLDTNKTISHGYIYTCSIIGILSENIGLDFEFDQLLINATCHDSFMFKYDYDSRNRLIDLALEGNKPYFRGDLNIQRKDHDGFHMNKFDISTDELPPHLKCTLMLTYRSKQASAKEDRVDYININADSTWYGLIEEKQTVRRWNQQLENSLNITSRIDALQALSHTKCVMEGFDIIDIYTHIILTTTYPILLRTMAVYYLARWQVYNAPDTLPVEIDIDNYVIKMTPQQETRNSNRGNNGNETVRHRNPRGSRQDPEVSLLDTSDQPLGGPSLPPPPVTQSPTIHNVWDGLFRLIDIYMYLYKGPTGFIPVNFQKEEEYMLRQCILCSLASIKNKKRYTPDIVLSLILNQLYKHTMLFGESVTQINEKYISLLLLCLGYIHVKQQEIPETEELEWSLNVDNKNLSYNASCLRIISHYIKYPSISQGNPSLCAALKVRCIFDSYQCLTHIYLFNASLSLSSWVDTYIWILHAAAKDPCSEVKCAFINTLINPPEHSSSTPIYVSLIDIFPTLHRPINRKMFENIDSEETQIQLQRLLTETMQVLRTESNSDVTFRKILFQFYNVLLSLCPDRFNREYKNDHFLLERTPLAKFLSDYQSYRVDTVVEKKAKLTVHVKATHSASTPIELG
ncbi:hypothetical protein WA158_004535 [Blastocystis sp. Blastoise]